MRLDDSPALVAFRVTAGQWLRANHPGTGPVEEDAAFRFRQEWQARLDRAGWLGLTWPIEHGGRGLTPRELAIFSEELALSRAPRPANLIGLEMSGPTLLSHGTADQKRRLLPPLLSGKEIWCQGFSEPGSGSDVASLRTRATATDGGWRITGQKVWTSFAHEARWCMLLARTGGAGHRGITCFLLDMHQPGVTTRRIPQITGDAEFDEVFLNGALVGPDDVLGGVDDGWRVAVTTLMHERANLAVALAVDVQVALRDLLALVRGRELDPVLGDRLARLATECEVLHTTAIQTLLQTTDGGTPGPDSALGKWRWAEVNQGLHELALEALGLQQHAEWQKGFLRSRANSIEGGTADILQNIVAERVLQLPRAR